MVVPKSERVSESFEDIPADSPLAARPWREQAVLRMATSRNGAVASLAAQGPDLGRARLQQPPLRIYTFINVGLSVLPQSLSALFYWM